MVRLTDQQRLALEAGQAVPLKEAALDCVLLRADVFRRLAGAVVDDLDPREAYPFVNDALREDDANDPLLDSYQQYR